MPGALEALHGLARALGVVAVISGRPAAFLAERLELSRYQSPLRAFGLHGLEEWLPDGTVRLRAGVSAWRPVIAAVADELRARLPAGVIVESKEYGVTAHWRSLVASGAGFESIAAQATEVACAAGNEHGLVPRPGKASVELVLPLGVDKGTVFAELCATMEAAAFLGDDDGDLAAFRALDGLREASGLRTVKIAVAGPGVPRALVETSDLVYDGPDAAVGFLVALAARLHPR